MVTMDDEDENNTCVVVIDRIKVDSKRIMNLHKNRMIWDMDS